MGQDAEGASLRKEYLTMCQNGTSRDIVCWNQDIFIYFKEPSGLLLCHWNWRHRLHLKWAVKQFRLWQKAEKFGCWSQSSELAIPFLNTRIMQFSHYINCLRDGGVATWFIFGILHQTLLSVILQTINSHHYAPKYIFVFIHDLVCIGVPTI